MHIGVTLFVFILGCFAFDTQGINHGTLSHHHAAIQQPLIDGLKYFVSQFVFSSKCRKFMMVVRSGIALSNDSKANWRIEAIYTMRLPSLHHRGAGTTVAGSEYGTLFPANKVGGHYLLLIDRFNVAQQLRPRAAEYPSGIRKFLSSSGDVSYWKTHCRQRLIAGSCDLSTCDAFPL
jgi:hypothetical protein